MMVFMTAPVLAPSIGQGILLLAHWRVIFVSLTLYALAAAAWVWFRLPETLAPERRQSVAPRDLLRTARRILATRQTIGYALAGGMLFGALFGFVVSAQQIFIEVLGLGSSFPIAFAGIALAMSLSSFLNSRLVVRFGMRRLSHGAVAVFILLAIIAAVLARTGALSAAPFLLLLAGIMFLLGMVFSNFNSLAMEPQGAAAGTASSLIGSISTLMATFIGGAVGQAYDGTLIPLTNGYLLLGLATLAVIALTERGRLFR
jgi:DHA1 family bicyclomycin/chloramphenicol resistance-like MFS transporter